MATDMIPVVFSMSSYELATIEGMCIPNVDFMLLIRLTHRKKKPEKIFTARRL